MISMNAYPQFNKIISISKNRGIRFFGSNRYTYQDRDSDIDIMIFLQPDDEVNKLVEQFTRLGCVHRVSVDSYGGGGSIRARSGKYDITLITSKRSSCYLRNCA